MRFIILIIIGAFPSLSFISSDTKILNIYQILKDPNYAISLKSNGDYSGNSVLLDVISKNNKPINLLVPAGTLFYPSNEEEQTLITPRDKMIAINKNSMLNIELHGFCSEANDRSPKSGNEFKVGNSKDEKLTQLLQFFKEYKGISRQTVQEAIWCVTDNESISNVYSDDPILDKKLKQKLSEITGQKIPWHTNKRKIEVDDSGNIIARSVQVTGEVTFSTTKKTTVKSKVINESGEVVFPNNNDFEIPKALKDIKLDFKIRVNGWEQGKYYVVYYTGEGSTILKKEFII